jgi:hypothetical protein
VNAPPPQGQPQPVQLQITPLNLEFPLAGDTPNGKAAALVITRQPLGERFVFLATVADWTRLFQAGIDAMRQHESGIVVPPPGFRLPPQNGAHS